MSHTDHYQLLGVSYDCTPAQLSSAYRTISLQLHPDKLVQLSPADRVQKHEQYLQVQQAYQVLRHEHTRQQYDAALQAGGRLSSGGVLSYTEVDLDDMVFSDSDSTYSYPCRCGATFLVAESVLMSGIDLFPCHQCSIVIKVLFEWKPEEGAEEGEEEVTKATETLAITEGTTGDDSASSSSSSSFPREFTAEEREQQLEAQRLEDVTLAREAASLLQEQKQLSSAIRARGIKFGLRPMAADGLMAEDVDDYTYHDKHHALVHVLFVEEQCDHFAPLCVAYVRKNQSHVMVASMAAASSGEVPPVDSGVLTTLEGEGINLSNARRHGLGTLPTREDAKFKFLITLDEEARKAADAITSWPHAPNLKRIHKPFPRPAAGDATAVAQSAALAKEFINELPDLLSFYA